MPERRMVRDQAALEALWQTRVVIDEICNPDWIGRVEEADFAFVRLRLMRELNVALNVVFISSKGNKIHEDEDTKKTRK